MEILIPAQANSIRYLDRVIYAGDFPEAMFNTIDGHE